MQVTSSTLVDVAAWPAQRNDWPSHRRQICFNPLALATQADATATPAAPKRLSFIRSRIVRTSNVRFSAVLPSLDNDGTHLT